MRRSRIVIVYVCLVGAPLLGLAGTLRMGQRLVAPLSVAGRWSVDADVGVSAGGTCRELLAMIGQPFFDVSQSGHRLTVALGNAQKTTLPGRIENTVLTIGADRADDHGCQEPRAIQLRAIVAGDSDSRSLTGTLGVRGCSACAATPIRAVRDAR